MDTSGLIVDYSEGDFADAIRFLLPKGEYWQEASNPELTNTIEGMAIDFKATHDEIELSLLTEFRQQSFGWRVRDYQGLLNDCIGGYGGVVFDDVSHPNVVYASLFDTSRGFSKPSWAAFEDKRLPHTEIAWIYHSDLDVHHQMMNCRHIRNLHQYEVKQ